MRIAFLIFFLYILAYQAIKAQNKRELDSLQRVYLTAKQDTIKVLALIDYAFNFHTNKPDTAISVSQFALSYSKNIGFKRGIVKALFNIGIANYMKGNYAIAFENYYEGMRLLGNGNTSLEAATVWNSMGTIHRVQENWLKAIECYEKALEIYQKYKSKGAISRVLNNLGNVYALMEDYPNALSYFQKSLKIQEELKQKLGIGYTLNNMANIYNLQKNYAQAITYYRKSSQIAHDIPDNKLKALTTNNLAETYGKMDSLDKSISYAEAGLKITKENMFLKESGDAYYILYNSYKTLKEYSKALEYYEKFKEVKDSLFSLNKVKTIANLEAKIQVEHLKKDAALKQIDAEREKNARITSEKQAEIVRLFELANKEKNAKRSDSLTLLAFEKQAEIEKHIILQQKLQAESKARTLEMAKEKRENEYQKYVIWLLVALSIVIMAFAWYAYRSLQKEKNNKRLMEQQKNEIESINDNLENMVKHRTEKLAERNKQLEKYAFYNAHVLRSPVANILGLYQILEMEEDFEMKIIIFQNLHKAVADLDKVVHQIQDIVAERQTEA